MTVCAACEHSRRHGWWGESHLGLTHCSRCHGSWPSPSDLHHCVLCCATFTSERAANAHRPRGGGCLVPPLARDSEGRPRFQRSTRKYRHGTTVTVWTLDRHTDWRHRLSAAAFRPSESSSEGSPQSGGESAGAQ